MNDLSVNLVSSSEAASIAGIKPSTFRTLIANGKRVKTPVPLPVLLLSGRYYWELETIQAWAENRDKRRGKAPQQSRTTR